MDDVREPVDLVRELHHYLARSKRGKSTSQCWEFTKGIDHKAQPTDFDRAMKTLRDEGIAHSANDIWYIRGRKYEPRVPRLREPSPEQLKFLAKQGRLF